MIILQWFKNIWLTIKNTWKKTQNPIDCKITKLQTNYTEIFGIKISRNYWLFLGGLLFCMLSYHLASVYDQSAWLDQLSIKSRNLFLYLLSIFIIRNYEMVKIPFQDSIKIILDDGIKNPHYGWAVLASAIYFGLIAAGSATVLIASV